MPSRKRKPMAYTNAASQILFAIVVVTTLMVSCDVAREIKVVDISSKIPIPTMKAGSILYVNRIARDMNYPGSFMHIQDATAPDYDVVFRFFEQSAKSNFYDGTSFVISYAATTYSRITGGIVGLTNNAGGSIFCNETTFGGASRVMALRIQRDSSTATLIHSATATSAGGSRIPVYNSDMKSWFIRHDGTNFILETVRWTGGGGDSPIFNFEMRFALAVAPIFDIEQVLRVGKYMLLPDRDGRIYYGDTSAFSTTFVCTSEEQCGVITTDLKPKFLQIDVSEPCVLGGTCYMIAAEILDDDVHKLTPFKLQTASFPPQVEDVKSITVPADETVLRVPRRLVRFGGLKYVALVTSIDILLYEIDTGIEAQPFKNMVVLQSWRDPVEIGGQLVTYRLTNAVVPDVVLSSDPKIPILTMFDVGNGNFELKMKKLSYYDGCISSDFTSSGCYCDVGFFSLNGECVPCVTENCMSCELSPAYCTQCRTGFVGYQGSCLPSLLNSNQAILLTSATPIIIDLTQASFTGYGKDLSTPVPIARKCSTGCTACKENYMVCTRCDTSRYLLYENKCYDCQAALPQVPGGNTAKSHRRILEPILSLTAIPEENRILVRDPSDSQLKCRDNRIAPYSTGYGPSIRGQAIIWQACVESDCSSCPHVYSSCLGCKSTAALFEGRCYACPSDFDASVHVITLKSDETGLECVTKSSLSGGYGRDITQPAGYWAKCVTPNCAECESDHTKCISCTANTHVLYELNCLPLSSLQPAEAYMINGLTFNPITIGAAGYEAFGRDLSAPVPVAKKCLSGCSTCAENYLVCTACEQKYALFAGSCYLCEEPLPVNNAQRLLLEGSMVSIPTDKRVLIRRATDGQLICHNRDTPPFDKGYGPALAGQTLVWQLCSSPNCMACTQIYSKCTTCATTSMPYDQRCFDCGETYNAQLHVVTVDAATADLKCRKKSDLSSTHGAVLYEAAGRWSPCLTSNCADCQSDFSKCTTCATNYMLYLNSCYDCGAPYSSANNVIVLSDDRTTMICVNKATNPKYSQGYGRDLTAIEGFWAKCSQDGCQNCEADHEKCTTCKDDTKSYNSKCLPCGATVTENHVILVDSSSPEVACKLKTDSAAAGFGQDKTQPTGIWARCMEAGCTNCQSNNAFCTACDSNHKLFEGRCFDCGELVTQAHVLVFDTPKQQITCTLRTDPAVATGYGQDKTKPTGFWASCVGGCATCTSDHTKCDSCASESILFEGKCLSCGSITAANRIVVSSSSGNDLECVDKMATQYQEGFGPDLSQPAGYWAKCLSPGCSNCRTDRTICAACTSKFQAIHGQCIDCDFTDPKNLIVEADGEYKCVTAADPLYSVGFGQDVRSRPRFWTRCLDLNCGNCRENFSKCVACKEKFTLHRGECVSCDMNLQPQALVESNSEVLCVDREIAPYSAGFGIDTKITSHKFIRPCSTENCNACMADYTKCTGCAERHSLKTEAGRLVCTPISEGSTSFPIPDSQIRRVPTESKVELNFAPNQSRVINRIEAIDLDSGRLYSCSDLGCKHRFNGDVLEVGFDSTLQITNGRLLIHRGNQASRLSPASRRLQTHRLLQLDESTIVVDRFVLLQTQWYSTWTTVFQIIFWVYRFFGSIALFPRYPRLAMLCDTVVNLTFAVSVLLGPTIPTSDMAVHIVANVRLAWYRLPNPFAEWNPQTLICQNHPKHAAQGLHCSFLDNYGHDLLAHMGLVALFGILSWFNQRYLKNSLGGSKSNKLSLFVSKYFSVNYLLAKLDANHILILLTSLVAFDKADSTSKSVVGRTAAILLLGILSIFVVATVKRLEHKLELTSDSQTTGSKTTYVDTEAELLHLNSGATNSSKQGKTKFFGVHSKVISFVDQNCQAPVTTWQILPVLVKYVRSAGLCILSLNFMTDPLTQTLMALFIQSLYASFSFKAPRLNLTLERYSVVGTEIMYALYLLVKAISTSESLDQQTLQDVLGKILGLLIALPVILTLVCQTAGLFITPAFNKSAPHGLESTKKDAKLRIAHEVAMGEAHIADQQQVENRLELDEVKAKSKIILPEGNIQPEYSDMMDAHLDAGRNNILQQNSSLGLDAAHQNPQSQPNRSLNLGIHGSFFGDLDIPNEQMNHD